MRKRRNTSWIDACASASAVEGQPDALSRDWSSQSDPKRALTNSFQVKADHVLFSRLMIATETAPVSLNTVDIRNIRSDCLLMSSGSGMTRPLRSWLADRDKCLERDRGAATCSLTIAQKSRSNEHDAKCAAVGAVVTVLIIRRTIQISHQCVKLTGHATLATMLDSPASRAAQPKSK